MNTRTGELAADVAFLTPDAIPVALIFGYNGAAIKSRQQVDAWGRPFVMGFESATTRSYAGGDAGEADSAFSCGVFDSWGYPRECGSWVCAADDPSTGQQFVPNIIDYGRRYALRQMAGGRGGPIAAYGNPVAVEALCSGVRAAGLVALRWGVGTWGYGEGGAGQPPDQADVDVLQSGNSAGPAPYTDLDWLYVPVATFAALGGPPPAPPTPPPAPPEEEPMLYTAVGPIFGSLDNVAFLVAEGNDRVIEDWRGPTTDVFGIAVPTAALDWRKANKSRDQIKVVTLDGPQMWRLRFPDEVEPKRYPLGAAPPA